MARAAEGRDLGSIDIKACHVLGRGYLVIDRLKPQHVPTFLKEKEKKQGRVNISGKIYVAKPFSLYINVTSRTQDLSGVNHPLCLQMWFKWKQQLRVNMFTNCGPSSRLLCELKQKHWSGDSVEPRGIHWSPIWELLHGGSTAQHLRPSSLDLLDWCFCGDFCFRSRVQKPHCLPLSLQSFAYSELQTLSTPLVESLSTSLWLLALQFLKLTHLKMNISKVWAWIFKS